MKKYMMLLFVLLLVTGCSDNYEPVENKTTSTIEDRDFTVELLSAKDVYKEGETIDVKAILTNTSDRDIQIGFGESWVAMGTTNLSKNYQYGYSFTEPATLSTMKAGDSDTDHYRFTGLSYSDTNTGEKYSEREVDKMSSLQFPKGQYEIIAYVSFSETEARVGYTHELSVIFTVE